MKKRLIIILAVIAAAVLSAGGVALASIPDSGGVIHACYKPNANGTVSTLGVVDTALPGGQCPHGQTAISWNQTGPQGLAGPAGPAGETGPQGPAGPVGVSGIIYRQASVSFPIGLTPPGVQTAQVSCPSGYVATGGGYAMSGPMGIGGNATEKWIPYDDDAMTPGGTPSGWEVGIAETGTAGDPGLGNYVLNAYVYCVPAS